MRKIALEEHFTTAAMSLYLGDTLGKVGGDVASRALLELKDFGDRRLAAMDAGGIELAILSLSGRGIQDEPDLAVATKAAKNCNDALAKEIQRTPDRYGGFAHLAMQDAKGAADELERCMTNLRFQGALIHGQTGGVYLDNPKYEVFWERAAALNAPIYLHASDPVEEPVVFAGWPTLTGPLWGWTTETSSHALRLVVAGVFERHPGAQVILGHMGECLPFHLWRFDRRYSVSADAGSKLPRPPSFYIRRNIAITTSGVCDDAAFQCSLAALGEDRVMFSVDWPFEESDVAGRWVDSLPISDIVKAGVCHRNAEALLGLHGRASYAG